MSLLKGELHKCLSEIELSGIITGRLVHQGIHGRTKKYKLTISSEMIKKTFKDDLTLQGYYLILNYNFDGMNLERF